MWRARVPASPSEVHAPERTSASCSARARAAGCVIVRNDHLHASRLTHHDGPGSRISAIAPRRRDKIRAAVRFPRTFSPRVLPSPRSPRGPCRIVYPERRGQPIGEPSLRGVPEGNPQNGRHENCPRGAVHAHRKSCGHGRLHVMLDAPARNAVLDAHGDVGQSERCGRFDQQGISPERPPGREADAPGVESSPLI